MNHSTAIMDWNTTGLSHSPHHNDLLPTLPFSPPYHPFPRYATVFAATAASLFSVVGLAGNLVTILGLAGSSHLRAKATTAFVISLAVSDLLFSAINLPLTAVRYAAEAWILGPTICRLYPFFFYGNMGASLMNMVAITVNRWVLIAWPGAYQRIYSSRRNVAGMIAGVWLFSFGLLVPPMADVWGSLGLHPATFSCTVLPDTAGRSPKKFLFVFGFVLPCLAIIVCYSAIFYRMRQSRVNLQRHSLTFTTSPKSGAAAATPDLSSSVYESKQQHRSSQTKDEARVTQMMLLIFVSFLVCFLPLMLVNVADDAVSVPSLHVLASVLAWMSAVVNPFIYAFKNRQYKKAFSRLLFCEGGASGVGKNRRSWSRREVIQGIVTTTPGGRVAGGAGAGAAGGGGGRVLSTASESRWNDSVTKTIATECLEMQERRAGGGNNNITRSQIR